MTTEQAQLAVETAALAAQPMGWRGELVASVFAIGLSVSAAALAAWAVHWLWHDYRQRLG